MKEELYTIPVNDAFAADCECPLCAMRKELEQNAIEYTMGPSYMEDDNRALTDEQGFCMVHIKTLYEQNNRRYNAHTLWGILQKGMAALKQVVISMVVVLIAAGILAGMVLYTVALMRSGQQRILTGESAGIQAQMICP